jgi:hypothetical protein
MAKEHGLIFLVMNGLLLKQILVIKNGLKKQTYKPIYLKIMIENKWAYAAVISMVLAKTAPSKEKQEACLEEVEDSRKNLIYEIEKEIIKEAERVSELKIEEFDAYFKKHIVGAKKS